MKGTVLFITGIDTNIGKTFATGMIACALAGKGKKVITQKMIQTGCTEAVSYTHLEEAVYIQTCCSPLQKMEPEEVCCFHQYTTCRYDRAVVGKRI